MGNGYRFYAGLKGSKILHVGTDTSIYEYQTLNEAHTAAQNYDTIVLAPGTHTLTAQLAITKPVRIIGSGVCNVTCSSAVTGSMVDIDLLAMSAAVEVYFEGISFQHGVDNKDVFTIDNTNAAYACTYTFKDCSILSYDAASTGEAIDLDHTTAAKAQILNIMGSGRYHKIGCVNFAVADAADVIDISNVYMSEDGCATAIITPAVDKAAIIRLANVAFKTATKGLSGGHSSQTVVAYNCYTESTGAAAVTGDLAGSQTETVVSP